MAAFPIAAARRSSCAACALSLAIGTAALTMVMALARPARASVVERVVAVVGEQAILLSDLRDRARPFLLRAYQELPPGARRTAAISQTYKSLLQRMVDDELEQIAATRARITVSAAEVDQALARVAAQNGLNVEQLLAEARRSGMSDVEYRREIRRQVLDAKMMNLRLQGRIRIAETDLRAHYQQIVLEERRRLEFRAAWIVVEVVRQAPREAAVPARQLAERISQAARRGADFGSLARQHSQDEATRDGGGQLGKLVFGRLPPAVDQAIVALEVGETSSPIRVEGRFVVIKLLERQASSVPPYEEALEELHQRVYLEKMTKARRQWLDSLRRQTHVDIRL